MQLSFAGKKPENDGAVSFVFKPIKPITWEAGQSIRLELPGLYGTHERRFSISSAPCEKEIKITTRLSDSEFKEKLDSLITGDIVDGHNIEGTFVFEPTKKKIIFAAAGIGITPYRSILTQADFSKIPLNLTLLYANRTNNFVFREEIDQIARHHSKLNVVYLPFKRISAEVIIKCIPAFTDVVVYLSGSSEMVDEVGSGLVQAGLPEESLKQDWFTGRHGWDNMGIEI